MTKSSSDFLQGLITAVIADCGVKLPRLHKEFSRDHTRLLSVYRDQGLSFFTIDLPDAGKHFDKCLASGFLTPFQLPHMRPFKKGTPIPRLFKGLLMNVFDISGALRADADTLSIRVLRELYNFLKKLKKECEDEKLYKEVRSFFEIERAARPATLSWDADVLNVERSRDLHFSDDLDHRVFPDSHSDQFDLFGVQEATSSIPFGLADTFQQVCDVLAAGFSGFNPEDWKPKHGPGAVSDGRGVDSKYLFPYWPDKLEGVFPLADFAFANYNMWADHLDNCGSDSFKASEPPSKLIAVPKTQKSPRLIASEPTAHQWIQQMLRRYVVHSLVSSPIKSSVRFNDQSLNQEAARLASLGSGHATVDLSSASDRMTCWVVERVFRSNPKFLTMIHACRTRWMVNSIDKHSPQYIILKKFACQGSALTFPLQTMIYTCAAIASIIFDEGGSVTSKRIRSEAKRVQVYGDDSVIPIDSMESYQGLLSYLGFKVNALKTYETGKFRESCGTEWYDGTNVTPCYFKDIPEKARPESVISAIQVSNNMFAIGFKNTADWIKSAVQRCVPKNSVPFVATDSGVLGWCRPIPDLEWHPRIRYDKHLQDRYIQVVGLSSGVSVSPGPGSSSLLQYFTEAPLPENIWKSGTRSRPKLHLKLRWERLGAVLAPIS